MTEEPHHAACRRRTPEEHAALWDADTDVLERVDQVVVTDDERVPQPGSDR